MNRLIFLLSLAAGTLLIGVAGFGRAQTAPVASPMPGMPMAAKPASDMVDGEVRKIDKDTKKITLKHGDIPNLEMPGMTMVFQVKDPAMLNLVKVGDKVKFKAEKIAGAIVVTDLQVPK